MQDEHTVASYNIENNHAIHMVARPANMPPSPSTPVSPPTNESNTQNAARSNSQEPLLAILNPFGGLPDMLFQNQQSRNDAAATNAPPRNEHSLEHLRQGLMTLRTLQATMPLTNNFEPGPDGSVISTDANFYNQKIFYVGQWVDVKDTVNQWLEATIMQIDRNERRMFVHYNGWYVCLLFCFMQLILNLLQANKVG